MELKVKSFGEISMADYVPGAEVLVGENQVRTSVQYLNNIIEQKCKMSIQKDNVIL